MFHNISTCLWKHFSKAPIENCVPVITSINLYDSVFLTLWWTLSFLTFIFSRYIDLFYSFIPITYSTFSYLFMFSYYKYIGLVFHFQLPRLLFNIFYSLFFLFLFSLFDGIWQTTLCSFQVYNIVIRHITQQFHSLVFTQGKEKYRFYNCVLNQL